MKNKFFLVLTLLIAPLAFLRLHGQGLRPTVGYLNKMEVWEDSNGSTQLPDVIGKSFKEVNPIGLNFNLSKSVFWFRITVDEVSANHALFLKLQNGTLNTATLFTVSGGRVDSQASGNLLPVAKKLYQSQYPVFKLLLKKDSQSVFYLKIQSTSVLDLPISINTSIKVFEELSIDQLYFGVYFGIILVMVFYNIFIYFTVRDKNYLYYVLYIISIFFLQSCLKGYSYRYLWSGNTWLTTQMPNIAIALSGIVSIFFVFNFLNLKSYSVRIYKLLWALIFLYVACVFVNFADHLILAQKLLQGIASIVAITIMTAGIIVYRKGYKPALFFNISWFFFLSSVIVYIMKDAGVLPYNNFTSNSILIGSGIEVSLLSFALADKINTYRKEREESQMQAQQALQENVRIVREQNVILDQKVAERTVALELANKDLNKALVDLKEAESQLVDSEKMASLGQLTAGIAHEINNPINFVTSNVKPLSRDVKILLKAISSLESLAVEDSNIEAKIKKIELLKADWDFDYLTMEIDQLLSGITDGATRTAEIVKGLRIFSRLDEDDLKKANLNEGLDATLIIINNLLNNSIKVVKKYCNLPLVECYPGKLNQVFLNILTNAIYAIKKKHGENNGGEIILSTAVENGFVFVSITDNGTGMDENTKRRLFEPFFTTKDVGEGTGLGLSIAYNTINKHGGQIIVNSELGKGTEFIIKLPLVQN